jgi:hypothetical protein
MERSMQIALLVLAVLVLLGACGCATEGFRGRRRRSEAITGRQNRRAHLTGTRGRHQPEAARAGKKAPPRQIVKPTVNVSRPAFRATAPSQPAATVTPLSRTVYSSKPLWYMEPVASATHHTAQVANLDECRTACGEQPECTYFQFKDGQCHWYDERPELEYNRVLGRMTTSVHRMVRP